MHSAVSSLKLFVRCKEQHLLCPAILASARSRFVLTLISNRVGCKMYQRCNFKRTEYMRMRKLQKYGTRAEDEINKVQWIDSETLKAHFTFPLLVHPK